MNGRNTFKPQRRVVRRQHGFSLIEIMVGVVIALVGTLVMFQTLLVSDGRSRTTNAGGEAQLSGGLAMYNLERDIKQAGMGIGMATGPIMGCLVDQVADSTAGRTFNFRLYPVLITQTDKQPDKIEVLYGNSSFFVAGQQFQTSTATAKRAQRRYGFQPGDLVVVAGNFTTAASSADCRMVQITDNTNADGFTLDHLAGTYLDFYQNKQVASRYNAEAGTGTTFSAGYLYNLGPSPTLNAWEVKSSRILARSDIIHNTASFEVAEGVVNLKAQYGVDSDGDNKIADSEWVTTDPTDWTQVRAIRVAILVRSGQFEKTAVTPAVPTWSGSGTGDGGGSAFVMRNVDGSEDTYGVNDVDPNNWRYYRYRVYEKVIPLRNMIWGTAPTAP